MLLRGIRGRNNDPHRSGNLTGMKINRIESQEGEIKDKRREGMTRKQRRDEDLLHGVFVVLLVTQLNKPIPKIINLITQNGARGRTGAALDR